MHFLAQSLQQGPVRNTSKQFFESTDRWDSTWRSYRLRSQSERATGGLHKNTFMFSIRLTCGCRCYLGTMPGNSLRISWRSRYQTPYKYGALGRTSSNLAPRRFALSRMVKMGRGHPRAWLYWRAGTRRHCENASRASAGMVLLACGHPRAC